MSTITLTQLYEDNYIESLKEMFNVSFKRTCDITTDDQVMLTNLNNVTFIGVPWTLTGAAIGLDVVSNQPTRLILTPSMYTDQGIRDAHNISIPHSNELLLTTTPKEIIESTISLFEEDDDPFNDLFGEENELQRTRRLYQEAFQNNPSIPSFETWANRTVEIASTPNTQSDPLYSLHVQQGDISSAAKYNDLVDITLQNQKDIQSILKKINPNNNPITSLQLEEPKE